MYLTKEEEKILNGEFGEGYREAMRILVTIGDIYDAERLVKIESAQVAGVSYKTARDAVITYLEHLASTDTRVSVPAFLNPSGMDPIRWREMGIDEKFAEKQRQIIELYRKLGIYESCTCTPYLVGNVATRGQHLAWSESSAVVFANSFFGARTNREGGPTALAAAIIGKTPYYGLHIEENRIPTVEVVCNFENKLADVDYALIGIYTGRTVETAIPVIRGLENLTVTHHKLMGAGMGASGAVPLYHILGITPESDLYDPDAIEDRIEIDDDLLREMREEYYSGDVDAVMIGCPHAGIDEISYIVEKIGGKSFKKEFWIFTSLQVKSLADRMGYTETLESAGARLFVDTCPVVAPISGRFNAVMTNSSKAAHYLPSMNGFKVRIGDLDQCIEEGLR